MNDDSDSVDDSYQDKRNEINNRDEEVKEDEIQ